MSGRSFSHEMSKRHSLPFGSFGLPLLGFRRPARYVTIRKSFTRYFCKKISWPIGSFGSSGRYQENGLNHPTPKKARNLSPVNFGTRFSGRLAALDPLGASGRVARHTKWPGNLSLCICAKNKLATWQVWQFGQLCSTSRGAYRTTTVHGSAESEAHC